MEAGMYHTSPSHTGNGLDGALSDAILAVSSDPTEREFLLVGIARLPKFSRGEDTIVRVQSFDFDADLGGLAFQKQLIPDCISGIQRLLRRMKDPATSTSMVSKDSASNIPMMGGTVVGGATTHPGTGEI